MMSDLCPAGGECRGDANAGPPPSASLCAAIRHNSARSGRSRPRRFPSSGHSARRVSTNRH